jgi:hypothetical protein
MEATGIGYAGVEGCWWLPACAPFVLPAALKQELKTIAEAVFALFDAVLSLYGRDPALTALLDYKVPPALRHRLGAGRVGMVRPDFQLVPTAEGLRPVATELEICPSAHGFAHAMQVAYDLEPDLRNETAALLAGRTLLFVGTEAWSEFLFEQLAFCKALAAIGAHGRVLYNRPLSRMAAEIVQGRRWRPPLFGLPTRPTHWEGDVLARIARHGLEPFWWPDDAIWPETVEDAVLFRFGYVGDFSPGELACFRRWEQAGARWLNPPHFVLDSKVILATVRLPEIRTVIGDTRLLGVLENSICETHLLLPDTVHRFVADKDEWLLKFAGFDDAQQAWGGRSLRIGLGYTKNGWRTLLHRAAALAWPVIIQRLTPSLRLNITYIAADGTTQVLTNAGTRLRCFFLRHDDRVAVAGAHLTACQDGLRVTEAVNAVQTPVSW